MIASIGVSVGKLPKTAAGVRRVGEANVVADHLHRVSGRARADLLDDQVLRQLVEPEDDQPEPDDGRVDQADWPVVPVSLPSCLGSVDLALAVDAEPRA